MADMFDACGDSLFSEYDYNEQMRQFFRSLHTNGIQDANGFAFYLMSHFEDIFKRGFLKLVWGILSRSIFPSSPELKAPLTALRIIPSSSLNDLLILITKYRIMWYDLKLTREIIDDVQNMMKIMLLGSPSPPPLHSNSLHQSYRLGLPLLIMWRDSYLKSNFLNHYDHVLRAEPDLVLPKLPDFVTDPTLLEDEVNQLFEQVAISTKRSHDEVLDDFDLPPDEEEVYIGGWKYTGIAESVERLMTRIINPFLNNSNSNIDSGRLQQACVSDALLVGEVYEYASELGKRNMLPATYLEVLQDHYPAQSALSMTQFSSDGYATLFANSIENGHAHNFMLLHTFNSTCSKQCDLEFLEKCYCNSFQFYEDNDLVMSSYEVPRVIELKNEFFVAFRNVVVECETVKHAFVIWVLMCKLYNNSLFTVFSEGLNYDISFLEDEIISETQLSEIIP